MRRIVVVTIIIFLQGIAKGNGFEDSLLQVISNEKIDTTRLSAQCKLVSYYQEKGKLEEAIQLAEKTKDEAIELNSIFHISWMNYAIGGIYYNQSKFNIAIAYFNEAVEIGLKAPELSIKPVQRLYSNIGVCYSRINLYQRAFDHYDKALKYAEKSGDDVGVGSAYINMGVIYAELDNWDKAMEYYKKALRLFSKKNHHRALASTYNAIANVYKFTNKPDSEWVWQNKAIELMLSMPDKITRAQGNHLKSRYYIYKKQPDSALFFCRQAIDVRSELQLPYDLSYSYMALAEINELQNNLPEAIKSSNRALDLALKAKIPLNIKHCYEQLCRLYEKSGDYKKALELHKELIKAEDVYKNDKNEEIANNRELQFKLKQQQLEDSLTNAQLQKISEIEHQQEIKQQKNYTYFGLGGFVLMLALAFVLFKGYQRKQIDNKEISKQKRLVEEKNNEITDSINYAHRIQTAMLPEDGLMQSLFPDSFVLLKPKDIVSGDFYWISKIGSKYIFTAADCTGHGVPGGFMSMVGTSLLNVIVSERGITTPSEILSELRHGVKKALKQTGKPGEQKDGMDMALCCYDSETKKLQYAGANNPLWLITGDKKEITEIKGDKRPVGYYMGQGLPFTNHEIQLKTGDCIYIFSDGFPDQFGGPKGKKFKYRPFKTLLLEHHTKVMKEQYSIINSTFEEWKGNLEQIDDVCIIGVRI